LWDALTEQAQTDRVMDNTLTVKEIMDTWILHPGFPVVNVTRNYEVDTLIVSQVPILFIIIDLFTQRYKIQIHILIDNEAKICNFKL